VNAIKTNVVAKQNVATNKFLYTINDEIREFQSLENLSDKLGSRLPQRLLKNKSVSGWIGDHLMQSSVNKMALCVSIISAYEIYLTGSPESCTPRQVETMKRKAKSLNNSLAEFLPYPANEKSFTDGLNALINNTPQNLPATASKRGSPRRRSLIENISTNIYDSLDVFPSVRMLTELVSILEPIEPRSLRNTYTENFKDKIRKTRKARNNRTNKNIQHSESQSISIIDSLSRKVSNQKKIEPQNKKTDIDNLKDAIQLLDKIEGNKSIARQASILKNELYELECINPIEGEKG